MIANYHTHTYRCKHARGEDEEYVIRAIERGLRFLGFSDHTPYFYFGDYQSSVKMLPEQAAEYFSSLNALKEKYKNKIEIKVGFETEYFPLLWDRLLELYKTLPVDYLILGQHIIGTESYGDSVDSFRPTDSYENLCRYTNQCIEAMKTGAFSCFAHPDVFNFIGDTDLYRREAERLVSASMEYGVALEINLMGLRSKRSYPSPLFWETAGKLGASAVIGCDAHSPSHIADPKEIEAAREFAESFSVKILDTIPLRKPF